MARVPTAYDQYIVELINRDRQDPTGAGERYGIDLNADLPAETISTAAKQPLAILPVLNAAAYDHAVWMAETGAFSHTGADASRSWERMQEAGWQTAGYSWTAGENIAFASHEVSPRVSTEGRHQGLFISEGHRKNLMSDRFSEIGVGNWFGDTDNQHFLTENFGDRGLTYITGVAFEDADGDAFYDPGEGLGGVSVTVEGASNAETTTWKSGGYALALPAGDYTVTFDGPGFEEAATRTASIGNANVKLDIIREGNGGASGPTDVLDALTVVRQGGEVRGDADANAFGEVDGDQRVLAGGGLDWFVAEGHVSDYFRSTGENCFNGVCTPQVTLQGDNAVNTLYAVERVRFDDGVLAFDRDGTAGDVYRLYQAAFDRKPDAPGLGFWIRTMDVGDTDIASMSANFIASPEFGSSYGTDVSDEGFIELLYANVLDRAPDDPGQAYWQERLAGDFEWPDVLAHFADSPENRDQVADEIWDGIWYV